MSFPKNKIAVIPGDGIGIDVTREAVKVFDLVSTNSRVSEENGGGVGEAYTQSTSWI